MAATPKDSPGILCPHLGKGKKDLQFLLCTAGTEDSTAPHPRCVSRKQAAHTAGGVLPAFTVDSTSTPKQLRDD